MNPIEELIAKYSEGLTTPEESNKLESLLQESREYRDLYREYMAIDSGLVDIVEEQMEASETDTPSKASASPTNLILLSTAVAAVIALLAVIILKQEPKETPVTTIVNPSLEQAVTKDKTIYSIAVISKAIDLKSTKLQLGKGSLIRTGVFEIKSGIAQIEFNSGVTMVLEGPTKLDIPHPNSVVCYHGKVSLHIPEFVTDFELTSGGMLITNIQNEISLTSENGATELFIAKGSASIIKDSKIIDQLVTNEARSWKSNDLITQKSLKTHHYVSHRDLSPLSDSYDLRKLDQWVEHIEKLRQDSDTILLYDFNEPEGWSRQVTDRSRNRYDGAIVSAQWTEGRWKGKKALDFKGISSRIRLNLEGNYKQLTLATWVRIDSMDQWLSSLLLSDGYNPGAVHWQLSDTGEMIIGMHSNRGGQNAFSQPEITPNLLGQWIHLVTVYDADNKKVHHYLNGKVIHSEDITVLQTIHMGMCEIGNWSNTSGADLIRSFNGAMDEFFILSRPLSAPEVEALYQSGRP